MPKFASGGHKGDFKASAADGALEEAQHNKLQLICDKLMLQEGESILDIGCGWGTLARHAAKVCFGGGGFGVRVWVCAGREDWVSGCECERVSLSVCVCVFV